MQNRSGFNFSLTSISSIPLFVRSFIHSFVTQSTNIFPVFTPFPLLCLGVGEKRLFLASKNCESSKRNSFLTNMAKYSVTHYLFPGREGRKLLNLWEEGKAQGCLPTPIGKPRFERINCELFNTASGILGRGGSCAQYENEYNIAD